MSKRTSLPRRLAAGLCAASLVALVPAGAARATCDCNIQKPGHVSVSLVSAPDTSIQKPGH